jgi:hypothetical protein
LKKKPKTEEEETKEYEDFKERLSGEVGKHFTDHQLGDKFESVVELKKLQ